MIGKGPSIASKVGMSKVNLLFLCEELKAQHPKDSTLHHLTESLSSAMDALHAHVFEKEKEAGR